MYSKKYDIVWSDEVKTFNNSEDIYSDGVNFYTIKTEYRIAEAVEIKWEFEIRIFGKKIFQIFYIEKLSKNEIDLRNFINNEFTEFLGFQIKVEGKDNFTSRTYRTYKQAFLSMHEIAHADIKQVNLK